jgi:hypothetical protein
MVVYNELLTSEARRRVNHRRAVEENSSKNERANGSSLETLAVLQLKKRTTLSVQVAKTRKFFEVETLRLHVVQMLLGDYCIDNDFEFLSRSPNEDVTVTLPTKPCKFLSLLAQINSVPLQLNT